MTLRPGSGINSLEDDGLIHVNEIDATTGRPLVPAISIAEAAAPAAGVIGPRPNPLARAWQSLLTGVGRLFVGGPDLGAAYDVDLTDPHSAGWAVVVASDAPSEARAAADRLLEHRRNRTGIPAELCKRFEYPAGHPFDVWLAAIRAHPTDIKPGRLPYYVTLIGGPAAIPFEAQSRLGAHYAVGRLAFDEPGAYARYVASLIDYEDSTAVPTARAVTYWGTRNRGDAATALSCDHLIRPLFAGSPDDEPAIAGACGFRSHCLVLQW
jgi:hypothetical protein